MVSPVQEVAATTPRAPLKVVSSTQEAVREPETPKTSVNPISTGEISDYTTSPANYENALAKEKQYGVIEKEKTLFIIGTVVALIVLALSITIYFFLSKYT